MIPVRCFSCGMIIGDKWREFVLLKKALMDRLSDEKNASSSSSSAPRPDGTFGPSLAPILDQLGLDRLCCRRHFIAHVDVSGRPLDD
jgi:DNA-directed RNA polymerase subunit N